MESTNLENRAAKGKALETFVSMSLVLTGRDVKAPKSYKEKLVNNAGLTDNPDYQAIDAFFENIEDDRLLFSILNVIILTHLRPTQLLRLDPPKAVMKLLQAIEEDDPYDEKKQKPSFEDFKKQMDEILDNPIGE